MSAEFVANVEDLLDPYAEPRDVRRPVACFDEASTQLLAETRPPRTPRTGIPLRQDYEYRREGVRNLFLTCEPLAGWRHVAVTQRRAIGSGEGCTRASTGQSRKFRGAPRMPGSTSAGLIIRPFVHSLREKAPFGTRGPKNVLGVLGL